MPKGTKVVDWTKPENDQKLFLAIIKTSEISNKYQAIANAFGGGIPAQAISRRIGALRRMAGKGDTDTEAGKGKKRPDGLMSGLKRASKTKGKKGKDSEDSEDENSDNGDESSDAGQAVTPPKTPNASQDKVISGRVTKRVSPRKTTLKDYKQLEDPFMGMEAARDDDGENVFGKPERSDDEDSNPTDGEFGSVKKDVKVEEE